MITSDGIGNRDYDCALISKPRVVRNLVNKGVGTIVIRIRSIGYRPVIIYYDSTVLRLGHQCFRHGKLVFVTISVIDPHVCIDRFSRRYLGIIRVGYGSVSDGVDGNFYSSRG